MLYSFALPPPQGGKFHQHFHRQSRAAFAQMIFYALYVYNIWQKCTEIWQSVQKPLPKIWRKISAEILVKQNGIFSAL
jgi:hypothetical protein